LRNSVEHSKSRTVRYCGQYWPSKGRVQIAILDSGVRIKETLSQNPHLKIEDDAGALKLATMPGISGKMYEGVEIRPYDVWQNSGYGLYMIYRMCRHAGSLFITSNNATLEVIANKHNAQNQPSLPGTSIRILFDVSKLEELQSQLKSYAKEGKAQAESLSGTTNIGASVASLMLHNEEE
jgi:hypothetical protein